MGRISKKRPELILSEADLNNPIDRKDPKNKWVPYTEAEKRVVMDPRASESSKKRGHRPNARNQPGQSIKYKMWMIMPDGSKALVPVGTRVDDIGTQYIYPYSEPVSEKICDLITEGFTLSDIGKMDGLPTFRTMAKWLDENEEFKKKMNLARKHRAHHYHDRIAQVADDVVEKTSKSSKVKLDAYKHLAALGDQDEYGNRTKLVGDKDKPIAFYVDTGIGPPPELPSIEASGGTVDDDDDD